MHRHLPTLALTATRSCPPCRRPAVCLAALVLCFAGTLLTVAADREGATFPDPTGRVAFAIPGGWRLARPASAGDVVAELRAPIARGTVVLAAESVPPDTTLDRYASDVAVRLEHGPRGAVALPTKASSRTLGGEAARAAAYEATDGGASVFLYQVVALHGGTAYTLTFATASEDEDAYFAQARAILDTFTFLDAAR